MIVQWYPILPTPGDRHPAPLRPSERKDGLYELHREPYGTVVRIFEPTGEDYLIEWLELKVFLSNILRLSDLEVSRVEDKLWNELSVEFDPDIPEIIRTISSRYSKR